MARIEVLQLEVLSLRLHQTDKLKVNCPYDWTYTTLYGGAASKNGEPLEFKVTSAGIDYENLRRTDEPILFYDEIILFEDELADNGIAQLSAKVRVMSSCVFVLLRFFLRVESQLLRVYDTRIYHCFDSNRLIRETTRKESTDYASVKQKSRDDCDRLMNMNWVAEQLEATESLLEDIFVS
jgi:type 2A phosphatase activator TIP41